MAEAINIAKMAEKLSDELLGEFAAGGAG